MFHLTALRSRFGFRGLTATHRRTALAAALLPAALAAAAAAGPAGPASLPFDAPSSGFDLGFFNVDDQAWWPEQMRIVDLDGDGDLDVVAANRGNFLPVAPRVSVILNRGDGSFEAPMAYVTPAASRALDVGDLDGDGDVDIMIADPGDHGFGETVTTLFNAGDGTFTAGASWSLGAAGPTGVVLVDVDGDGDLDAATANNGRLSDGTTVSILRNQGDGTFASAEVHAAGAGPFRIAAGDLDGDGDADLVVANDKGPFGQTRIHRLMNDSTGDFGAPSLLPPITYGGGPSPCLALADMDGDADLDVVYSDLALSSIDQQGGLYAVAIHRNAGDGSFGAADRYPMGASTGGFSAIAVGDVTGDGLPDVIGTHDSNQAWGLLHGTAAGGLTDYTHLAAGEYPRDAAIADMDGDGDREPVILSHFSQTISIHDNDGSGVYAHVPHLELLGGHYHFDAGDADGDGDLDLVASTGYASNGSIAFYRNLGDGEFGPFPVQYVSPTYSIGVKLRDMNGDGLNDLIWADKYPPYSFRTRHNLGGGQFGPSNSFGAFATCGVTIADAVQAFDLDGDGDRDVVLMENLGCPGVPNSGRRIFLGRNDGDGAVTLVDIIHLNWSPFEMMADDLDGDGNVDLIVASRSVEVLMGRGDLSFDPPVTYGGVHAATHGTLADVNGDGATDVLLTVPGQGQGGVEESLGVMFGGGDGTFGPLQLHRGSHSPNLTMHTAITAGDIDGDGDADALLGNYAANDVSIFRNRGDGSFEPQFHVASMESIRDLTLADLDGDGRDELLAMASFAEAGELGQAGIAVLPPAGRPVDPGVPGDVDGDGVVGLTDLVSVLATWGPCPGCPTDLDGNGIVDLQDLIVVLAGWTD